MVSEQGSMANTQSEPPRTPSTSTSEVQSDLSHSHPPGFNFPSPPPISTHPPWTSATTNSQLPTSIFTSSQFHMSPPLVSSLPPISSPPSSFFPTMPINLARTPDFGGSGFPFQPPLPNIWSINIKNFVTTTLATVDDFLAWRTQFVAFLITHELVTYVDGTMPPPPQYIQDIHGMQHSNPTYAAWLRIDQCIRTWLFATVTREVLSEIHNISHSSQIWSRLTDRFNTASLARAIDLQRMLSHVSLTEDQTMEDYLRKIKNMADCLAAIHKPVADMDLVQYTIGGLSAEYDSFVTTATYFSGTLTFDELRTKLLFHENRI